MEHTATQATALAADARLQWQERPSRCVALRLESIDFALALSLSLSSSSSELRLLRPEGAQVFIISISTLPFARPANKEHEAEDLDNINTTTTNARLLSNSRPHQSVL